MKPLVALILLLMICAPGCVPTQTTDLTPAQRLAQNERTVKISTGIAVRAVLVSMEPSKADQVAGEINRIAKVIDSAATSGTIDLGTLRAQAALAAEKIKDDRIRLLVSSAIESIIPIVETQIESRLNASTDGDKVSIARGLISSAARGAIEATEVWAILSPTTKPVK